MGIMIIPSARRWPTIDQPRCRQAMRDGSAGDGRNQVGDDQQGARPPPRLPGVAAESSSRFRPRDRRETMIVVMAAALRQPHRQPIRKRHDRHHSDRAAADRRPGVRQPKTLAAFALGLVLFVVTLLLNIVALRVVKKYREAYE
jgi:phosphate transport system permease protein